MRVLNLNGRLAIDCGAGVIDVESASGGLFSSNVQAIYSRWNELVEWAEGPGSEVDGDPNIPATSGLGSPVPSPTQVFAIGLNYQKHAEEAGLGIPDTPMVFTKFPSSVTGPYDPIVCPPGFVDYEVELVVVIGTRARNVSERDAWSYVAGLTVGQDLSERDLQVKSPAPQQFSLAKSFEGFAPLGPWLVTPDELDDPNDLGISCDVNGTTAQSSRTSDLIFSVSQLVSYLSTVLPLLPGDLIFTGTPSGTGWSQDPQRAIVPGDVLVSRVEGIGEMRHTFVAPETAPTH